ncbi:unnamed protein product [Tilletia controversa]|nr:unnamed protein product [Tilletia controversa]
MASSVAPTASRPNPANMRIIGAGIPRTGTLSMKQALDILGFPCHHMAAVLADRTDYEAKTWTKAGTEGLTDAEWDDLLRPWQACIDAPSACFYKQLADLYPDAKIIVTTRDAKKWLASMQRTIGVRRPGDWEWFLMSNFSPALRHMTPMWKATVWKGCFKDLPLAEHILPDFVGEVLDFFRARGELDRVLVYDIDSKEEGQLGWTRVCPFLEVPVPEGVAWPDVNASDPEKVRRMQDAAGDATRAAFGGPGAASGEKKDSSTNSADAVESQKALGGASTAKAAVDASAGVVSKDKKAVKTGFESYMGGARPSPNAEVARIKHNLNWGLQVVVGSALVVGLSARAWACTVATPLSSSFVKRSASVITTDPAVATGQVWDYVIVGGGLAGLTVANRLTENSGISVLVIEAGADTRDDFRIRSLDQYGKGFAANNTDINWRYTATNGKLVSAGKGLGGSTSINGAAWTRGDVVELDNIGRLGNTGWNYDSMLSYMNKAEKFTIPNGDVASLGGQYNATSHGFSGYVSVRFGDVVKDNTTQRRSSPSAGLHERFWTGPQQPAFVKAVDQTLGIKPLADVAAGKTNGVAYFPNTFLPGPGKLRSSSAIAYLSPIEFSRSNLVVLTNFRGWKLIWDPTKNATATGVVIQQSPGGPTYNVSAKREVIVAAGSIKSPIFLEHSGVGNATVLSKLRVPLKVNLLGVGANLQEQTNGVLGIPNGTIPYGGVGPGNVVAFGSVAQLMPNNVTAVRQAIESKYTTWARDAVVAGAAVNSAGLIAQWKLAVSALFDYNVGATEFLFTTGFPTNDYGIELWPLLPFSRGYVHAVSADAFSNATVNPRYFSVPFDMDLQVASSRAARRILQGDAFKNISSGPENKPGFKVVPDDSVNHGSYATWQAWISKNFGSVAHPIATCSLAPRAMGGVVDPNFLVYGTTNVRVVDASMLPMQISAHLSSTLYGIAERAADFIKAAQT